MAFLYVEETYRKDGARLFMRACSDNMRGMGSDRKRLGLNQILGKKILTVRVVRHWNQLLRKAVDVLCLEVFKAGLDRTLSNLIQ